MEKIIDKLNQRIIQSSQQAGRGQLREVRKSLDSAYEEAFQDYKSACLDLADLKKQSKISQYQPGIPREIGITEKRLFLLDEWIKGYGPGGRQFMEILKQAREKASTLEVESDFLEDISQLSLGFNYLCTKGNVQDALVYHRLRAGTLRRRIAEVRERIINLAQDIKGTPHPGQRKELFKQQKMLDKALANYVASQAAFNQTYKDQISQARKSSGNKKNE